MRTLIAYPNVIKRAEAYKQLDTGEIWGPLWPFIPKEDGPTLLRHEALRMSLDPGQTFETYVEKVAGGYTVEAPVLNAGEYYPRIWRRASVIESFGELMPRVEDTNYAGSFVTSLEQIEGLFEDLLSIFRVVHPAKGNLEAFGGGIRDIIILACTEVEAQWKGVLDAHNVKPAKGSFFTTRDYVKLLPVMKLNEYVVKLTRYPWLPPTGPFFNWNRDDPTKSLTWYDAYNKIKHDREDGFINATLGHAIESVAACVVMLGAQFGIEALKRNELKRVFEFVRRPEWDPKDWYYQPIPREDWVQVPCPM
jgi:hypothetical protein